MRKPSNFFILSELARIKKGETLLLKKLLALVAVLLVAGLMAVPSFAQPEEGGAVADLGLEWGTYEWFVNQFGVGDDISVICETIGQDEATKAGWTAQFPDLPSWCGW